MMTSRSVQFAQPAWQPLAAPRHVSDDLAHQAFVDIDPRVGAVSELRVDAIGDAIIVEQIVVDSRDGTFALLVENQDITRGRSLTLSLGGCYALTRITIYGYNRSPRSSFVVSAR